MKKFLSFFYFLFSMPQRIIIFCIVFILFLNVNFSEGKVNDFDRAIQSERQIAYIGEVLVDTGTFGSVNHRFFLHDEEVKWLAESGKVEGTVQLNYSIFYLFEKLLFPRFIAVGFSIYFNGEKIGENKIFTLSKEKKSYYGERLLTNVSFDPSGKSRVTLHAIVWYFGFPADPFQENAGLLNWLTFGMFDAKRVKIEVEILEKAKTINQNSLWLHSRHDIQNTGFTPAIGKGNRLKKIFCKHLIGMELESQKLQI